jgi:hypothetical protein
MRAPLAGVTVSLDATVAPSSTTVATVGASVLVLATTLPEHAVVLTSSYLACSDGALAVSHLRATRAGEVLEQHRRPPAELRATLAGVCLLDHASALQDLAAAATTAAVVGVDVDPETLERVAEAWGPPCPPG